MPCGATLQVTAVAQREGDVDVSDHADVEIRVLPILPRERTDQLIRDQLRARGWVEQPDGSLHQEIGDAVAVLPPDANTVRVTLSDETSVSVEAKATGRIQQGDDAARAEVDARAARNAEAALAEAADGARRALEARTAKRLLEVWHGVRAELDEVVNQTTKQALQERAAELGSIDSVSEGHGDHGYEITITVRT